MNAAILVIFFMNQCFADSTGLPAKSDVQNMSLLPKGTYVPFVLKSTGKKNEKVRLISVPVTIEPFFLDKAAVTNQSYLLFLQTHPEWRKSKIPRLFADAHYLENWKSDLEFASSKEAARPVTRVSWFAARAYCEAFGKELPTTDQWEYALADQDRNKTEIKNKTLAWYSKPNSQDLPVSGAGRANGFGVKNLVDVVWEWTRDFSSSLAGDELRDAGDSADTDLFCGGASLGMLDPSDYATLMRYSFRTSLKASYTTANLGFRCAKEHE
jgi:sulfatase modifying factor 1